MKIAAIIPARKGSKRLPGKNRFKINNSYIINKVYENLAKSEYDIDLFISTDDSEFNRIIDSSKVKILERDPKFSDDFSTVVDLVKWHYKMQMQSYDLIIQTFCHSICIDSSTFDSAILKIMKSERSSLLTISRLSGPVEWTFKIYDDRIEPNFPNQRNSRSQDLGISYIDAGQFYIYKTKWFSKKGDDQYDADCEWIEIPHFQSNDLDEEGDFEKLKDNYRLSKKYFKNLV